MFRKEANEVAICLAIDGWCSQPDFQAISMCAVKRVGGSPGLDIDGQQQVFSVPLVPMRSQRLFSLPGRDAAVLPAAGCCERQGGYRFPVRRKLHELCADEWMNQHFKDLEADEGKQW